MARIKLNFSQLPIPEKVAKANQIVTALTGHAVFTNPTPELPDISAGSATLSAAYTAAQAARQQAKTTTSAQNIAEDNLERLLSQLAGYVESVAGDNEQLIHSAGMDTRAARTVIAGSPNNPASLAATAGDHDGEIDLSWEPTPQAKSYIIEQSADPPTPTSYLHAGVSTRSSKTISGLTSGTRYWFRVAAVSTGGESGWSDPATKIAP